jgi:hypothetical protein
MSMISPPEAERRSGEAGPPPGAQALIEEARAHARRRRLTAAVSLVVAMIMAAAGVLVAWAVTGTHSPARSRPRAEAAAVTGIVTGRLSACFAIAPRNRPLPVTPGTVVVLPGRITWKPIGPGSEQLIFPKGPVPAQEHISDNYHQTFRFVLPPGQYVIAGRYGAATSYYAFSQVTVAAGTVVRVNLPNVCI